MARSREEGLEKGLVKEREEERLQLNYGMRKNGITIEDISRITDPSLEEINRLIQ